jgi:cytochrome c1
MGRPGMSGPDLTKVGAAHEHTKEWLADQIREPKKHKQEPHMPVYGPDKISDEQLNNLTTYLASLKEAPAPKEGGKEGGKGDGKEHGKEGGKEGAKGGS